MIGAIPISQYSFDLSLLNDRYDILLSEPSAKEAYKKHRGYNIAWNWANERDEFYPAYESRIERNRRQAIYRLTRRYDNSFLQDLSDGNSTDFSMVRTIMSGPFFVIGASAILNWMDTVEAAGITVVLGTVDSIGGGIRTYRDSLQREKAVRKLIRKGNKWQRDDVSRYPFVEFVSGAVKGVPDLVYFLLKLNA